MRTRTLNLNRIKADRKGKSAMNRVYFACFLLVFCASYGAATPTGIYGQPVPLDNVGSLSTDVGLVGGGDWADSDGFKIAWDVSTGNNGWYNYSYLVTNENDDARTGPALSHLILEVSSDLTPSDLTDETLFRDFSDGLEIEDDNPRTYTGNNPSNPNMPESIWGIKFDVEDDLDDEIVPISFQSTRIPIWGNFYAKGGQDSTAWNTGLDPSYQGDRYYVPVPDTYTGTSIIPEPSTVALFVLGVSGLALIIKRRTGP